MDFKGNACIEEFSSLLKGESARCIAIVTAAFFDETLGSLLGDKKERSLQARIDDASDHGLLTQNESSDLHTLRRLRNKFAHDLRARCFDPDAVNEVESLKLWKTASTALPQYESLLPTTGNRLMYVAGVIGFRLQHRTKNPSKSGALPDTPITDFQAWPPIVGS